MIICPLALKGLFIKSDYHGFRISGWEICIKQRMLYGDSLEMLRRWDELGDGSNGPNVNKDDFIRLLTERWIWHPCNVLGNANIWNISDNVELDEAVEAWSNRYMILENIMTLISRFEHRSVKHLKGCKGSL